MEFRDVLLFVGALCLLAGCSETQQRRSKWIDVQAHRGARAERPESTLPAFRRAIELGADTLELDLAVTRDDQLVVHHDPRVSELLCQSKSVPIRSLSLEALKRIDCGARIHPDFPGQQLRPGTPVASFAEVLALVRDTRTSLNIETKVFPAHPDLTPPPRRFAALVVEALRGAKMVERSTIQSFDRRTLRAIKELEPRLRTAMLNGASLPDFLALARATGTDIISPHHEWILEEDVKRLHAAGILVIPWTVNDVQSADRLLAMGVDGIITDDPAMLINHLRGRGLR